MYRTALALQAVHDAMTDNGAAVSPASRQRQRLPTQPLRQAEHVGKVESRLKLSGVQKMMIQGILKVSSLGRRAPMAAAPIGSPALIPSHGRSPLCEVGRK
jgi:hypothetical protein